MLAFKHVDRDLSTELTDSREWQSNDLRHLDILLDVASFAYDPVFGLLAVGTDAGIIRVLGGPAVDVKLDNGAAVRSIHFSPSVRKLVCVDVQERIRVWDLASPDSRGVFRLAVSTGLNEPISAVSTSPSHAHILVILLSGEVRAYDLITSTWSPRPAPNLWSIHEDKMLSSGVLVEKRENSRQGMTLLPHPRDLGLIFVAYEGGVTLCDLQTHTSTHAYELILPPGAPGGMGYHQKDLMTSRYPPVTAVAIHPSGHILAVGHLNGEITFWAIEDEDKPITCMTIDEDDVHILNGEKLQLGLDSQQPDREPIFKLVWSGYSDSEDPRGGATTLVILGGRNDNVTGVLAFHLPAFNPPEPPADTTVTDGIHPTFRAAMRAAVTPSDIYLYATPTPVVDFMLIPKTSPHFGGSYDPQSILILTEAQGGTRTLEARKFPPPQFNPHSIHSVTPAPAAVSHATTPTPTTVDVEDDLTATLAAMNMIDDPQEIELPPSLWSGKNAPIHPVLIKLERDAHTKLTHGRQENLQLPLSGGQASPVETPDSRLSKFAPHRIIVSHHRDMTIRFQDLDAQLLVSEPEAPLLSSFPRVADELSIDVLALLADSAVSEHFPPALLQGVDVSSVQLSSQTLDVVVTLNSGEVILYRIDGSSGMYWQSADDELVCLEHVAVQDGRRYYPVLMVVSSHGSATAASISDIGLFAIGYGDGSVLIVDAKSRRVLLRETRGHHQKKSLFHKQETSDAVISLTWTSCGLKRDPRPRVRLIGVTTSGHARIYTLDRRDTSSAWSATFTGDAEGVSEAFNDPDSNFVIEGKTGFKCRADMRGVTTAMDPNFLAGGKTGDRHWVWVVAGAKGARAHVDVNGDRIGRADWPAKAGNVIEVKMVERTDASTLVAFTDRCQALVYSLPSLELLHTLELPYTGKTTPIIAADTTGDYLIASMHSSAPMIQRITYGTLFAQRRSYYRLPRVDLIAKGQSIPPAPVPVSMGPGSLIGTLMGYVSGPRIMTGEDIDAILAGKERPKPASITPQARNAAQPGPSQNADGYNVNAMGQQIGQGASVVGQQINQGASAVFGRLQGALSERGEMLDSLQDSMKNLQEGSKNALNQARMTAAKQGAKSWFSSIL